MRGMHMRHDGWAELVNDEKHGGCLIPMMMLCHEHDEDPEMRPEPITPEKREDSHRVHGSRAVGAYRYFRTTSASHPRAHRVNPDALPRSGGTSRVPAGREEVQEVLRRGDGELSAL